MSTPIFTVSDFNRCCWISNISRILKMQISTSQKFHHGYVIKLTHIFFCLQWPRTPCYTRHYLNCMRNSIVKGVDFNKQLKTSVPANWIYKYIC